LILDFFFLGYANAWKITNAPNRLGKPNDQNKDLKKKQNLNLIFM